MDVRELLHRIAEHGVTLRCGRTEYRLDYAPAGTLQPELVAELRKRKTSCHPDPARRRGVAEDRNDPSRAPSLRSGARLPR